MITKSAWFRDSTTNIQQKCLMTTVKTKSPCNGENNGYCSRPMLLLGTSASLVTSLIELLHSFTRVEKSNKKRHHKYLPF